MPGVNGHVLSSRLLHASMSISSLAPAAAMLGSAGFTATAGSFCLFCGNGVDGLPIVTNVSSAFGVAAATPTTSATALTAIAVAAKNLLISPLLRNEGPILTLLFLLYKLSRSSRQ